MSAPLQLSFPESAHVHIHLSGSGQGFGHPAAITAAASPGVVDPKKRPLRFAAAALLVFGSGYLARSVSAPDANAQRSATPNFPASPFVPPSAYSEAPPGTPGSALGLPPGFQVSPRLNPYSTGQGQYGSGYAQPGPYPNMQQPMPQGMAVEAPSPAGLDSRQPPVPPRAAQGITVQAPFPAAPDPGQPAPSQQPARPRNPFGLQ